MSMLTKKALDAKRAELKSLEAQAPLGRAGAIYSHEIDTLRKEIEKAERENDRLAAKKRRLFKGQTSRCIAIVIGDGSKLGEGINAKKDTARRRRAS